jgi:hypothetical protein
MTLATLREFLHSALSWIERWVSAATVIDWVVLAVAGAALIVAWRWFTAPTRLGDIEVSAGDKETTATDFGRVEIAAMRRELAQWGVVPAGGVPAGSPTATIAAAVEASPIEQAKFVGALLRLIPVPAGAVGFKVTATVEKDAKGRCALTYHLVRTDTSETLELDRIDDAESVDRAIVAAAGEMFRTIAASAEGIFPPWSQWPDSTSMMYYREALQCERKGQWEEAANRFADAAVAAPDNMLPRLRVANCLERRAGIASGAEQTSLRVRALDIYKGISAREPHVFEARYRASVLAGVLADELPKTEIEKSDTFDMVALRALEDLLGLPHTGVLADRLSALEVALPDLAQDEARAARRELHAYSTLRRAGRLRNRLEPRGRARRETLRALRISRLALHVRHQWSPGQPLPTGRGELQRYWWRFRVRLNLVRAGWQAHYNAACFYALLPEVVHAHYPWANRDALVDKAFEHLCDALRDPQKELDCAYVRDGDPDLQALHAETDWTETMRAFCPREALVNYVRRMHDYTGWRLRVSGSGLDPSVDHATLGAERNGTRHATFRVPLRTVDSPVSIVMVNGKKEDPAKIRSFIPGDRTPCTIWVYEGEEQILDKPKG